jgi:hypothetical protein
LKKRNKKLLFDWLEAGASGVPASSVIGTGRTTRVATPAIRKSLVVVFFRKERLPLLSSASRPYTHIS